MLPKQAHSLRMLLVWLALLAMLLVACGDEGDGNEDSGGDDGGSADTTVQDTPLPDPDVPGAEETEEVDPLVDPDDPFFGAGDVSGNPVNPVVLTYDELTLETYNVFTHNEQLQVMFVVRNDGEESIQNIKALLTLVDENNLRIVDYEMFSPFRNIAPGQTILMTHEYLLPPDYHDLAARIIAQPGQFQNFQPYPGDNVRAELNLANQEIRGAAVNLSGEQLVQPVAIFGLFDANGEIIGAEPAMISGLNENGFWLPEVAIEVTASIRPLTLNRVNEETEARLFVVGYIPGPLQPASADELSPEDAELEGFELNITEVPFTPDFDE